MVVIHVEMVPLILAINIAILLSIKIVHIIANALKTKGGIYLSKFVVCAEMESLIMEKNVMFQLFLVVQILVFVDKISIGIILQINVFLTFVMIIIKNVKLLITVFYSKFFNKQQLKIKLEV